MLKPMHVIALLLVILGAINWGLVGLFQFDAVAYFLGGVTSPLSRVVYVLVGIAGLLLAVTTATIYSDWRTPRTITYPSSRY